MAKSLGGKIEIANDEFHGGQIALLRDPMGAGFTIYQGNKLNQSSLTTHGTVIKRALHTSNAKKVIEFYKQLFNWKISIVNDINEYHIYTNENFKIASILELSNEVKGKYEYWITTFGVSNLQKTKNRILDLGGSEVSNEGTRILFTDSMGEAFFYIEEIKS